MIPNIFISSTIQDLGHLRDSIRDVIQEIGYNPVMSEHGEIGFLPTASAEDSCYIAMKDCQMAVIIVGKRYGSKSVNGLSITHNEFRTARAKSIPVIFLVNEEVLSFKRIFDANELKKNVAFPGMEDAPKVFQFIQEFSESNINNGLLAFSNVQSAKTNLKKQLALIVGELLKKQFDPLKGEIKDILSEITTLRHLLLEDKQKRAKEFIAAMKFLLDERNKDFKEIMETFSGSLEEGITDILKYPTFKSYVTGLNIEWKIFSQKSAEKVFSPSLTSKNSPFEKGLFKYAVEYFPANHNFTQEELSHINVNLQMRDAESRRIYWGLGKRKFWGSKNAEIFFELKYRKMLLEMKEDNSALSKLL